MNAKSTLFNPFPGLRSFRSDEDHLFFGREEQALELVSRLQQHRFIAVVGSSGRGKSSLVRCGLLSRLQGGGMAGAGAHWEIAVMHPGGDPLRHLADALLEAGLYQRAADDAVPHLLATLGRSQFGLVEAVRQAALPAGTNFLLVVDQFEEIFRYDEAGEAESEVANDFIAMLREACAQSGVPIYVVVTMRSDFIGDCSRFDGLAEAVNRGEYLIPRLSREQFKSAIEGPIRVAGGRLAPRLLQRLLNDVGEEQDQLPCLQHALMRTWRVWQGRDGAEALDLEDYAQVGKMSQALSLHADEVYAALATDRQRELCAAMFKALTVEGSEKRGIRRPRRLLALGRILDVEQTELLPVIDAFRQPEVSFLMPPADVELRDATVIDLSHESLMRVWTRLRAWVDEEAQSVRIFHRLAESAALWRQGRTGLCRDPELAIARAWRQTNRPNAAWAEQYAGNFDEAMAYLDASTAAADGEIREREERARAVAARKTRRQRWIIGGLASAVVALLVGAFFGIRAQHRAERAAREQAAAASRTDFVFGSRLLDDSHTPEGLAYLVRAAREDPANYAVPSRLISALAARSFAMPIGEPKRFPVPIWLAWYIPGGDSFGGFSKDDDMLRQWSMKTGQPGLVKSLKNSSNGVWSRDGKLWAIGDLDGTIRIWESDTGKVVTGPLHQAKSVGQLRFSPDGKWLASTGAERVLKIWNVQTGEEKAAIPFDATIARIAFSQDSQRLVSVAGTFRVWRVPTGEPLSEPQQTTNPGTAPDYVDFSSGDAVLAIGDSAGVQFYNPNTLAPVGTRIVQRTTEETFSHDGKRLATASTDGTARIWEVPTGRLLVTVRLSAGTRRLRFSDDGRLLEIGSDDEYVRIVDATTGNPVLEPVHASGIVFSDLQPDGSEFLTAGRDQMLRRWQIAPGAIRPLNIPANDERLAFVPAPDGAPFAWAIYRDRLEKIDLLTGRRLGEPRAFPVSLRSAWISPDGARLAVRPQNGAGELWKIGDTGVARLPLAPQANLGGERRFSASSQLFAANDNAGGVCVWNANTGALVAGPFAEGAIDTTELNPFSHDDRRLLLVSGIDVLVYDLTTGQLQGRLSHRFAARSPAFSPDDQRIATEAWPNNAQLWDARTLQPIGAPMVLRSSPRGLRFTRDGRRLLTLSLVDARLWDAATGAPLTDSLLAGNEISMATFSTDESRLATYDSALREVRIWDTVTGHPLAEPMKILGGSANTPPTFLQSDRFLAITAGSGLQVWPVPPATSRATAPTWLLRLAVALAGGEIDRWAVFREQPFDATVFDSIRHELAVLPADAPYAEWGRWFLADRATRSIAPGFTITPAEAEKLAQEVTAPAAATTTPTP